MRKKCDEVLMMRIRHIWDNMFYGAKSRLYSKHGWTKQNVADIIKNGRKDENTLKKLIDDMKESSLAVADDIEIRNKNIQSA